MVSLAEQEVERGWLADYRSPLLFLRVQYRYCQYPRSDNPTLEMKQQGYAACRGNKGDEETGHEATESQRSRAAFESRRQSDKNQENP